MTQRRTRFQTMRPTTRAANITMTAMTIWVAIMAQNVVADTFSYKGA